MKNFVKVVIAGFVLISSYLAGLYGSAERCGQDVYGNKEGKIEAVAAYNLLMFSKLLEYAKSENLDESKKQIYIELTKNINLIEYGKLNDLGFIAVDDLNLICKSLKELNVKNHDVYCH